jgi:hypothetical protein
MDLLDALSRSPFFRDILLSAENLTRGVQRAILGERSLAREFTEADISPAFRANGTTRPDDPAWLALAENGFADWRLRVGGLVERPAEFSLADLRAMPSRTQITRHDCVEGWSCIGKWTRRRSLAVQEKPTSAGWKPEARATSCSPALPVWRRLPTARGRCVYEDRLRWLEDAFTCRPSSPTT